MPEQPPFEPITRDTVSSQIRDQLLKRVTTGEMAPGSPIPSERELSARFQVARTSVREALQGLLSMGVIERRGNRSYVAEHLPSVVVERGNNRKTFVAELFETRRVLEVPIFEMAADRADQDDRDRITQIARSFHDSLDIPEFRKLDREFHTSIAQCCGNPLLIELYAKVLDELFRSGEFDELLGAEKNRTEVKQIIATASAAHLAIAEAFQSGDASAMRSVTKSHLDEVEHAMVEDLK